MGACIKWVLNVLTQMAPSCRTVSANSCLGSSLSLLCMNMLIALFTRLSAQHLSLKSYTSETLTGRNVLFNDSLNTFYLQLYGRKKEGNVLFNNSLNTFYLQIYGRKKEGNVLFNDSLNTFYLQLYGVGHMVKDNSDSERGNLLPPHRLLFPISSKGSFICIIPQTG